MENLDSQIWQIGRFQPQPQVQPQARSPIKPGGGGVRSVKINQPLSEISQSAWATGQTGGGGGGIQSWGREGGLGCVLVTARTYCGRRMDWTGLDWTWDWNWPGGRLPQVHVAGAGTGHRHNDRGTGREVHVSANLVPPPACATPPPTSPSPACRSLGNLSCSSHQTGAPYYIDRCSGHPPTLQLT